MAHSSMLRAAPCFQHCLLSSRTPRPLPSFPHTVAPLSRRVYFTFGRRPVLFSKFPCQSRFLKICFGFTDSVPGNKEAKGESGRCTLAGLARMSVLCVGIKLW